MVLNGGPDFPSPINVAKLLGRTQHLPTKTIENSNTRTYLQTSLAVRFDRPSRRLNRHRWGLHLLFKILHIIEHSLVLMPFKRRADAQTSPEGGGQAERPEVRSASEALFSAWFECKRRRGCIWIGLWGYTCCHWFCIIRVKGGTSCIYVFALVPLTTQSQPSKELWLSWCRTVSASSTAKRAEGGIDDRWQRLMTFCEIFSSTSFAKFQESIDVNRNRRISFPLSPAINSKHATPREEFTIIYLPYSVSFSVLGVYSKFLRRFYTCDVWVVW